MAWAGKGGLLSSCWHLQAAVDRNELWALKCLCLHLSLSTGPFVSGDVWWVSCWERRQQGPSQTLGFVVSLTSFFSKNNQIVSENRCGSKQTKKQKLKMILSGCVGTSRWFIYSSSRGRPSVEACIYSNAQYKYMAFVVENRRKEANLSIPC